MGIPTQYAKPGLCLNTRPSSIYTETSLTQARDPSRLLSADPIGGGSKPKSCCDMGQNPDSVDTAQVQVT